MLHVKIGNVLSLQGKLDDALKAYRNSLAIAQHLATVDNNTQRQRDLSASYVKVGNGLLAKGKFSEAFNAYSQSLTIAQRLVAADRNNTQHQRDLIVSMRRLVRCW